MRTYIELFIIVFSVGLVLHPFPAAADDLKKMSCLKLLVESPKAAEQELGFTREDLENALLVAVKVKMPRITVRSQCNDWLYLSLTALKGPAQDGREITYAANVTMQALRPAVLDATNEGTIVRVWDNGRLLAGSRGEMRASVNRAIDTLVEAFAAAYYKAGNP